MIPEYAYGAALCALARLCVGDEGATAFAQELTRDVTDLLPCSAGIWIVTVRDGARHVTYHAVERGDVCELVEIEALDLCSECGDDLGYSARYEADDYQDLGRGRELVMRGGWAGCASCIEYQQGREEAA